MRRLINFLLIVILVGIGSGVFLSEVQKNPIGIKVTGFSVLAMAFVLMPMFIYHRYKDKDLSKGFFNEPPETDKRASDENKKRSSKDI
ncbi:MAG: hypothetical protein RQ756_00905 [Flavobacteriaceae bacterium]|nr:hypothetical protein [Flavobacteriaceae bacterium]